MPSLRILVLDLPPLLDDLIRFSFERHEDIVTVSATQNELSSALTEQQPDAIIVPLGDGNLPGGARQLLMDRARLRVLGIGLRDGRSVLFELRPERTELGDVAPDELPVLIRAALDREITF